jgi:hypothetical protein
MQLGPEDVLLNLSVDFRDALAVGEVEARIDELAPPDPAGVPVRPSHLHRGGIDRQAGQLPGTATGLTQPPGCPNTVTFPRGAPRGG